MQENREGKTMPFKGRDHHGEAFSMWMAGGGIKGGTTYGETDEIGYSIVSGKTEAFDIVIDDSHKESEKIVKSTFKSFLEKVDKETYDVVVCENKIIFKSQETSTLIALNLAITE